MVECGKEYVLQWPGHAAYVTERFSGLFAKQSLVDLTLLCDEQRLKVHKLVLASCSLYFEEILADDLGTEAVILFKDLEFSILKAMIEFMYCGETTVSHINLPSLLAAARSFKVKELESLVEKMVGLNVPDHNDNGGDYPAKNNNRLNGMINNDDNDIRVSCINGASNSYDSNSDSESGVPYLEDSANESCLYEDQSSICRDVEIRDVSIESGSSTSSLGFSEKEHCCDFDKSEGSFDEEINRVGQCSRVYTHKRRKPTNNDTKNSSISRLRSVMKPSFIHNSQLTSNQIDLEEDPSDNRNEPVTLHRPDFMLSFSNESIQSIVGCSISDFCQSNGTFELLDPKHLVSSIEEVQEIDIQPVLRRSNRLNPQENYENDSILSSKSKVGNKPHRPNHFKQLKGKNTERDMPNVKLIVASTQQQKKSKDKSKCAGPTSRNKEVLKKPKIELKTQQMNSSALVSRALWGDMSDISELDEEYQEYSNGTDIPFAVGLLPLRAALEKLQATPDYQPRKTRSSAASTNKIVSQQENSFNGFKRKHSPINQQNSVLSKKPSMAGEKKDVNSSVQKSASPLALPKVNTLRKRSLSESASWTVERTKSMPGSP